MYTTANKVKAEISTQDFVLEHSQLFATELFYDKESKAIRKSTLKHIKNNDYFAILAMLMELISEKEKMSGNDHKIFDSIKKELMYLHNNYKIIKKSK